jgi:hypothetical protein
LVRCARLDEKTYLVVGIQAGLDFPERSGHIRMLKAIVLGTKLAATQLLDSAIML